MNMLVPEHGRVVFDGTGHRVGREEPDEGLAHRVGLVRVGRIARHVHRVDLIARREYVAHRVQRVGLVVVLYGRAEVEGVGRVFEQRVLDRDDDAAAATRQRGLLLHRRRGVELLLLVLDLDVFVELDIDFRRVQRAEPRGKVVGLHGHDHGRQRILRTAGGRHRRGALGKQAPHEQQHEECRERCGYMICYASFHFIALSD